MKQRALLFLVFLLFIGGIYAQDSTFSLRDYKLPKLKRSSLTFDTRLSQRQNDLTGELNSYINTSYYHYQNNRKWQREYFATGSISSTLDYDSLDLTDSDFDFNPNLYLNLTNRYYFSSKYFLEGNLNIRYNYTFRSKRITAEIYQNSISNTNSFYSITPLKVGWGRIEHVEDARQAVYIIDKLQKADRFSEQVSNKEVFALAAFISNVKNKRFFDSRIKKMRELELLDSFLIKNNYLKAADMRYFATLNDIWEYGDMQTRKSGKRVSFSFIPGYLLNNYSSDFGTIDNPFKRTATFIGMGIDFYCEKPIHLSWQKSIHAYSYYSTYSERRIRTNENLETISSPDFQLGYTHGYGYYPNTRTSIFAKIGIKYMKMFDRSNSTQPIQKNDGEGVVSNLSLYTTYYFSPRLSLQFSASVSAALTNNLRTSMLSTRDYVYPFNRRFEEQYLGNDGYFDEEISIHFTYTIF